MSKKRKYPNIEKMQPHSCLAAKAILSMRSLTNIYKKHLKKHDITQSQLGIMIMLGHCQKIPQADLGRMLLLERSTVSRDLKRLIENGYLKRQGAVNKLNIEITEKGMGHLEAILPDWEKARSESEIVLGEDGMQALDLVLAKLSKQA
jgi:DNA-binding MarR family transcriptional regulator